jgi:hypothetical protein
MRVDLCGNFRMFLEDNSAIPRSIWFSGEAYFHLNAYVNKQNMRVWAAEHVHNIIETPLHPPKNAWYSLILPSSGAARPNFFHFSRVCVSNSKKDFSIAWALSHTMNAILDVLNERFDYKVLFNHFPEWFRNG